MQFFTIYLSKDGNKLVYGMSFLFRAIFIFFFISFVGMFIFSFSINDFIEAPLFGKIFFIFIITLVILGTFYEFSIIFDKNKEQIKIRKGLIFFYSVKTYSFDDFKAVKVKKYFMLNVFKKKTYYYEFGFFIGEKFYLIDRKLNEQSFLKFYLSFKYFWPKNFIETE